MLTYLPQTTPYLQLHSVSLACDHRCDLLIVMGTSLKVEPFASLATFPDHGTPRLLINRERVGPFHFVSDVDSGHAGPVTDVFYQGDCDAGITELTRLAGMQPALEAIIATAAGTTVA